MALKFDSRAYLTSRMDTLPGCVWPSYLGAMPVALTALHGGTEMEYNVPFCNLLPI